MASLIIRRDCINKNLSVLITGYYKRYFHICQISPILLHHSRTESYYYKASRHFHTKPNKRKHNRMGRTTRRRRRRQKECVTYDSDFTLFTEWLLSKGWEPTTKMKLKHFHETGRGFMAMEPVSCGDVIVRIPKDLVITAKTVEDSEIGEIFLDKNTVVPVHLVLTTFLLYEKHLGNQSNWYRYISILPKCYSSPVFATPKEIENFPSFLADKVKHMRNSVHSMYKTLLALSELKKCKHCQLPLSEIFSSSSFLWAWFTVNSRDVYISPQENLDHSIPLCDDNSVALVPYLDMLNHSNSSRISAKFSLDSGYELRSLVSCKKYDQVFIHYGSHDNLKLFLEYGFIVPNNYNDTVPVTINDIVAAVGCQDCIIKKLSNEHLKCFLKNLSCSTEGLSWNCRGLIYLLLVKDISLKSALQNVYAGSFSPDDPNIVKIEKIIISGKIKQFTNYIYEFQFSKKDITSSIGKALLESYLAILNLSVNI